MTKKRLNTDSIKKIFDGTRAAFDLGKDKIIA